MRVQKRQIACCVQKYVIDIVYFKTNGVEHFEKERYQDHSESQKRKDASFLSITKLPHMRPHDIEFITSG